MINFRYHLISIVAVFLALGIGVVMGSTVIDRAIVDSLKNRIETAEQNSIDRKAENNILKNSLEKQNLQNTVLAPHSVQNTLNAQTVYVATMGDVDVTVKTETLELLGVSGARTASVIDYNEDFLRSNKTQVAKELKKIDSVNILIGDEKDVNRQISIVMQAVFNIQAGGVNDLGLPVEQIQQIFKDANAYTETDKSTNFDPVYPISYLVLVKRTDMENENFVKFLENYYSRYPVTIGLVGSEQDTPSRSKAIGMIDDVTKNFALLDNAESPSGRAAFLLAHAQNIAGTKAIYGVSDKATAYAPELATS